MRINILVKFIFIGFSEDVKKNDATENTTLEIEIYAHVFIHVYFVN